MHPASRIISLDEQRSQRARAEKEESVRVGARMLGSRLSQGEGYTNFLNFRAIVPAGAQVTVAQNPQKRFQPGLVVIPSSLGLLFTVDDMSVATCSQNVAPGTGSLAQIYSEISGGMPVNFDEVCEPGVTARMVVTNISLATVEFFASWFGESQRACG